MLKKLLCVILALIFIFSLSGCGDDKQKPETEVRNEVVGFKDKTDEDKKSSVLTYVKEKHNLEGVVDGPIYPMEYHYLNGADVYYACVNTNNFNKLCCWINQDGTVTDSSFTWAMQENIAKMFKPILTEYINNFKIYPVVTMKETSKQWQPGEEMDMIKAEKTLVIEVFVFANESEREAFNAAKEKNFDNKLNFAEGSINIEFVDDINKLDLTNKTMNEYEYGYGFGKDIPNRDLTD